MSSKDGLKLDLLTTKSRNAFKTLERKWGWDIAFAAQCSSLNRGNDVIHERFDYKICCTGKDLIGNGRTIQEYDWNYLHELGIDWINALGYHEAVCNRMGSELGLFSSFSDVFGRPMIVWTDFADEYVTKILLAGEEVFIVGIKGSGKTHLACLFGEKSLKNEGIYVTNIDIDTNNESVHVTICLSEVLRIYASTTKHITLVLDEIEAIMGIMKQTTKEYQILDNFYNLTRKLKICVVTIWHYMEDIPKKYRGKIDRQESVLINKYNQKSATVHGVLPKSSILLTDIPKTEMKFKSVGAESAASFEIDIDPTEVFNRLKHLKGSDTNKKLLEILDDPSIYLKKYRSKDSRDNNVKQKLDKIYNKVIENIDDYISITGRSLDFNKISNVFDISQANAKTIKNEILKSEEFKEYRKKRKKEE